METLPSTSSSVSLAVFKIRDELKKVKRVLWEVFLKNIHSLPDSNAKLRSVLFFVGEYISTATELCEQTNGISGPDVEWAVSDVMFPIFEKEMIAHYIRPVLVAHFAIWRQHQVNYEAHKNLETSLEVSQQSSSSTDTEQRTYLESFLEVINLTSRGYCNMRRHWEYNVIGQARQLGLSYIRNLMRETGDLRFSWFKEFMAMLKQWMSDVGFPHLFETVSVMLYKDVIDIATLDIYDIVAKHFPSTYRIVSTLRFCMTNSNNHGREKIVASLIDSVQKELLNCATDTRDILNIYARCVESLRVLDSTCVIMHRVCSVIREYLKKRPDTIQQIISYITTDKKDEIEKHMTRQTAMMDEDELHDVNAEFLPTALQKAGWKEWNPDPCDAISNDGHQRQIADVFNMLVSVYGSKEMFVKEYRLLLADRLMSNTSRDPEFEEKYLDLLKLRFQFSELHHCKVMLVDAKNSLSFDEVAANYTGIPISTCIISAHYWPRVEREKGERNWPALLEESMKTCEKLFSKAKNKRRLQWLKGVGCVDVSMELDGVKIEKTVPSIYADVLFLMLEKESWTSSEVAEKLGISVSLAKRRLDWWVKQGLLIQELSAGATSEVWTLTRNSASLANNRAKSPEPMDDSDVGIDDSNEIVDSLEQYWTYTLNYITSTAPNGEVKAERMHRMYRMFGSPNTAGPTLDHVNTFLQRKVQLGLLVFANGVFRAAPK